MNIFLREMKASWKSLVLWCAGAIVLITSGMGKYAGFSSSGQSINELMEQMPKSMQAILGVGAFDLSKASGFYGLLYVYILLLATIHAAMLGANIIAKEERDKTAEFLFVKPVERRVVILYKMMAAACNVLLLTVTASAVSFFAVSSYSNGEAVGVDIVVTMIGMLILQLIFLTIGFSLAANLKNSGRAASLSASIMLITFFVSVAIDLNDRLGGLKFLTPFKYFEAKIVMYGGGLDPVFVVLSLIIIVMLFLLTIRGFKKRDLRI